MSEPTQIHDDIPAERAWKVGRRIYVRCGYHSALNAQLRDLGAKWDREERALWVGSGKLDKVLPLLQAQTERITAVQEVKAGARWVMIPYDATEIRAAAKQAGGIWDAQRKRWAMPTDEALAEITGRVQQWQTKQAQAQQAQRAAEAKAQQAEQAARAEQARLTAAEREQQIITRSGRTLTGPRGTATGQLHGRMRRRQAEAAKPQPGDMRQLSSGQRVLVLACNVQFVSQDAIDDGVFGDPSMDAGWYFEYRYAVVEPTEEEAVQDAREQAERDDEAEIRAAFEGARRAVVDRVEPPQPVPVGASITTATGSMGTHDGRLTLTEDGQVWWYHPGYYDDWRAMTGRVVDQDAIALVQAVIAGGSRRRGYYEVQVP